MSNVLTVRRYRVLLALLAAAVLGAHATHLPMLVGRHGDAVDHAGATAIAADLAQHDLSHHGAEHAVVEPGRADHAAWTTVAAAALPADADGVHCPVETVAILSRGLSSFLIGVSAALWTAPPCCLPGPSWSEPAPPPLAHRRRALLQVYLT